MSDAAAQLHPGIVHQFIL